MNLSRNDLTVIEQALKQAMNNDADYQAITAYQQVLDKLKEQSAAEEPAAGAQVTATDGFRYDYDDASDVYKRTFE